MRCLLLALRSCFCARQLPYPDPHTHPQCGQILVLHAAASARSMFPLPRTSLQSYAKTAASTRLSSNDRRSGPLRMPTCQDSAHVLRSAIASCFEMSTSQRSGPDSR